MESIKNKVSFGLTAKESENIKKACEMLKVRINPNQRIEIPVDTAQIGERFHISTTPANGSIKLETKLTRGSNQNYATQSITLKDIRELEKIVKNKNFNEQIEIIFENLKSVLRKMENNHK